MRKGWPALLALYILSPLCGELMSGSSPPLSWLNPFTIVFVPLLYGSSAILIHEVVARRGLSWGNVLLLGAGFGIFQEALVVQTWFNVQVARSPSYSMRAFGIALGTSWPWALDLTLYHAVISITIPLVLITLLFPRRGTQPWLGRKGSIAFAVWLVVPCALLAVLTARVEFAKEGYTGPDPRGYVLAVALLLLVVVLGVFVRFPVPAPDARPAPGVWRVRFALFGLTTLAFVLHIFLEFPHVPAVIAMLAVAAVVGLAVWRVRAWSARAGWGARHWLAVAMGVLAFFLLLWDPLLEWVVRQPNQLGVTEASALVFVGLFALDRRLARRVGVLVPEIPSPTLAERKVGS